MELRALILITALLAPLTGYAQCSQGVARVERSQFATAIEAREPGRAPVFATPEDGRLFFFTEVRGGEQTGIVHRWLHEGRPLAAVALRIGGEHWRTWSSFRLAALPAGELQVQVYQQDCLLVQGRIDLVTTPAASRGQGGAAQPQAPAIDVAAVLAQARAARQAGELERAQGLLDTALRRAGREHADYRALADERGVHLALAQARQQLRQRELAAMDETLDAVERYLRQSSFDPRYQRLLESHRLALGRARLAH